MEKFIAQFDTKCDYCEDLIYKSDPYYDDGEQICKYCAEHQKSLLEEEQ